MCKFDIDADYVVLSISWAPCCKIWVFFWVKCVYFFYEICVLCCEICIYSKHIMLIENAQNTNVLPMWYANDYSKVIISNMRFSQTTGIWGH